MLGAVLEEKILAKNMLEQVRIMGLDYVLSDLSRARALQNGVRAGVFCKEAVELAQRGYEVARERKYSFSPE